MTIKNGEVNIALEMNEVLYAEDVRVLQEMAWKIRLHYFGKKITFYLKPYTPVSVTGTSCQLACRHCNRHYLKHMEKAASSEELRKKLMSLSASGIQGVVLSGGSSSDGSVPLYEYAETVKKIKEETGLVVNAHTGLVSKQQAEALSTFIDSALTDVVGDAETIREVFGLKHSPEDYRETLKRLREAGIENITPHIIIGLHHGHVRGELKALEMLREIKPDNIVMVVFIPTENTLMEEDNPPPVEDVAKIIALARILYPLTNISLSCVRPGGRYRSMLDTEAVKSGVNKIAVPSKSAYKTAAEMGLEVNEIKDSRCCSW